jgi:hypothetical protein
MKRDWTATAPWCEHSAWSWEFRDCGVPWCRECENYTDGWRRNIRRPSTWFFVAFFLVLLAANIWWQR